MTVTEKWPSYSDLLELSDYGLALVEQRVVQLAEQIRIVRKDRMYGGEENSGEKDE